MREVLVRVVHEEDGPEAGAYVNASDGSRHVQAQTDATGVARLLLPPGGTFSLYVFSADRQDVVPPRNQQIGSEDTEVTVVLRRAYVVAGRLVGPGGEPIANVNLTAKRDGEVVAWARAGAEGAFRFALAEDGPVDVEFDVMASTVMTRGAPPPQDLVARVEGVQVGTTDLLLQAERVAMDATLVVRVLDPDGGPVQGAHVVTQPHAPMLIPQTGPDGTVTLTGLRLAPVRVQVLSTRPTAERPWVSPEPITVEPRGQTVEIRLMHGLALVVRVREGDQVPAEVSAQIFDRRGRLLVGMHLRGSEPQVVAVPVDAGPLRITATGRRPDQTVAQQVLERVDPTLGEIEIVFPADDD
jgi:hypothetical protein